MEVSFPKTIQRKAKQIAKEKNEQPKAQRKTKFELKKKVFNLTIVYCGM